MAALDKDTPSETEEDRAIDNQPTEEVEQEQAEGEGETETPVDAATGSADDDNDDNLDDELSDVDEDAIEAPDLDEDVARLTKHKRAREDGEDETSGSYKPKKNKRTKESSNIDDTDEQNTVDSNNVDDEDEDTRKKRLFEEKFAAILKKPSSKRRGKSGDVDLEAMQDEAITHLKNMMKDAAYYDTECINNKKPATSKLKLLPQVRDTLLKSNLYDSILDNNLLEAVRIWLEPLPDGSLPAFEIQKTLFSELTKLPIKTIHLRESGLGKIMVFYQNCKKVDPILKRTAEKLIGDWTRPILGRSDNYRARKVQAASFDFNKYEKDLRLSRGSKANSRDEANVRKSLYEESADRRKRAAAPAARTSVYTVAPQVNPSALYNSAHNSLPSINKDERFRKINQKLNSLSQKKKAVKKGGVSIEGRGLAM